LDKEDIEKLLKELDEREQAIDSLAAKLIPKIFAGETIDNREIFNQVIRSNLAKLLRHLMKKYSWMDYKRALEVASKPDLLIFLLIDD